MLLKGKTVLITTNSFKAYAGSEIVTLEIVEWFISKGAKVDLFTNFFGQPMSNEVVDHINSQNLTIYSHFQPPKKTFNDYAFIWINHSLLPVNLVEELGTKPLVPPMNWHHMGVIPPLEAPLLIDAENKLGSSVTYISKEVHKKITRSLSNDMDFYLFDNPAATKFIEFESISPKTTLSKLLVVSNHLPTELKEAIEILKEKNIEVITIGAESEKKLISPEYLSSFDCVVTIGKTVQYALTLGVPAFCYDKFGGCGWLTNENLEIEADFNFSGRATNRKISSNQIVTELLNGFETAQKFTEANLGPFKSRWNLDKYMDQLISLNSQKVRSLGELESLNTINLCRAREGSDKSIYSLQEHYDDLVNQINSMKISHDLAHKKLFEMQNSGFWKLLRFLKRVIRIKISKK